MSVEIWITIFGLGLFSFLIGLSGYLLASQVPQQGAWARSLQALPGCLIVSLVSLMMLNGSMLEWISGTLVLIIAAVTRKPTIAMFLGMLIIATLRVMTTS